MRILIVSFVDDNFGDILIRICFENLLKVVLKNLNIESEKSDIKKMSLKKIDSSLICNSDIIFFAGGGLFGLSYLNFFDYIDEITQLAEKKNIPVIFSSIGINNMDAVAENEYRLKEILENQSIVSISVRENIELFQHYIPTDMLDIEQVCDPAVWTKYVYASRMADKENISRKRKLVGINVVRGGLFKANKKEWQLRDEIAYLNELKSLLDINGYDYKFYTNGSFLDNNSLRYYAKEYNIPDSQLVFPDTTRDLVETIAEFDYVVAIRMHSSIISYAFSIPSVNLVWNDKIPFFYDNIGYSERAITLENWDAEKILTLLKKFNQEDDYKIEEGYLMSLYHYLYKTLSKFIANDIENNNIFDFERVVSELEKQIVSDEEDVADIRLKLNKGERHYLSRFIEIKEKNKEIKAKNKEIEKLKKERERLKLELNKKNGENNKLKKEVDKWNRLLIVRISRKIKRILKGK